MEINPRINFLDGMLSAMRGILLRCWRGRWVSGHHFEDVIMASRQEISRQLAKLVIDIPAIRRRHPDSSDFIETLAAHADSIVENAEDDDADWAESQVDSLLEKHRDTPNG